jgi:hypothetical protein
MSVVGAEPLTIPTERVFAEESYWRRLADERGSPGIRSLSSISTFVTRSMRNSKVAVLPA